MGGTAIARAGDPASGPAAWPLAALALAALLPLTALPAAAQSGKRWTCVLTRTGEERLIDLEYAGSDVVPCLATDRLPGGGSKTIADYRGTRGMCESTVESVLANLGRAGYQCSGPVDLAAAAAPDAAAPPEATAAPEPPEPVPAPPPRPEAAASPQPEPEPVAAAPEPAEPATAPGPAEPVAAPPAKTDPAAATPRPLPPAPAASGGHFAIVSTHMVADFAQKAVAELRLRDPFMPARVLPPRAGAGYWSVALAADAPRDEAEAMVVFARREELGRLPFLWSFPDGLPAADRAWVAAPDEWQPAVVRACREDGADSVRAMAECSGLLVTPETLASCLAGSVCRPEPITRDRVAGLADRPLPAAQAPGRASYAEPMIATTADAEACLGIDGDPAVFGACMAAAMMTPAQRAAADCRAGGGASGDCAGAEATPEERLAAACAATGDDPFALVSCAGGRIAGRELARCASLGAAASCLGPGGLLAPALRDIADDLRWLPVEAAAGLRAELEEAAAEVEHGTADAVGLRRALRDLGNELLRVAGPDAPVVAAFDDVAPRRLAR